MVSKNLQTYHNTHHHSAWFDFTTDEVAQKILLPATLTYAIWPSQAAVQTSSVSHKRYTNLQEQWKYYYIMQIFDYIPLLNNALDWSLTFGRYQKETQAMPVSQEDELPLGLINKEETFQDRFVHNLLQFTLYFVRSGID